MALPSAFHRVFLCLAPVFVASSALFTVACGAEGDGGVDPLHECVITAKYESMNPVTTLTGSYAETGRIITADYVFELDEVARTIAVSGNAQDGPTWYWTNTYDAVGHLALLEHRDGTVVEYENAYDGDRILSTRVIPFAGQNHDPGTIEYFYDDAANPDSWTREVSSYESDPPLTYTWTRTVEAGKVTRAEQLFPDEPTPRGIWTYAYENEVLTTIERDQGYWDGSDGVPDIRFSWSHDDQGLLRAFEQDGTDHLDAPTIDGVADFRETYSPGCSALLDEHPWLAHLPDRDETTPGFRVAGVWRARPAP